MNGLAVDQYAAVTSRAATPMASYISPTIIEERTLNVAQMDVFSRLMMDRIIFLGTEVNDYTANVIQAQLLYLDSADPGKDVSIYINSPGGSVYAGLGIYDTMQYISSDVTTICTGIAASMAAVLLSSGTKGKRFVLPNSMVLIHQPLGGAQGQQTEIAIVADFMLKTRKRLNKILSENTGQSIERIQLDTERDNYMTAEEAKEYGLVDEIIYHHGAMPGQKKGE